MKGKTYRPRLEMDSLDHLFTKPDVSPLSADYRVHSYTSGIEFIAGELHANMSYKDVTLTLVLPEQVAQETDADEVLAAIGRYTAGKLTDIRHDRHGIIWRGIRAFLFAMVALFVFIALSKAVAQPGNVYREVLSEGLAVAGWVALWFPLELLSFGLWEQNLEKKIYERISKMSVTIES